MPPVGIDAHWEEEEESLPCPYKLKEVGNDLFHRNNVDGAIEIWKHALKEALKASVRSPTPDLVELQIAIRMNLAAAFMRQEDWIMAKEHMTVAYDQACGRAKALAEDKEAEQAPEQTSEQTAVRFETPAEAADKPAADKPAVDKPDLGKYEKVPAKHFYRLAQIYLGLQDYDHALDFCRAGLELHQDDKALLVIQRRIQEAKLEYLKGSKELFGKKFDITKTGDDRTQRAIERNFDATPYASVLADSHSDAGSSELATELAQRLVKWNGHSDDWRSDDYWNLPWTGERVAKDKTAMRLALPLSILGVLEELLLSPDHTNARTSFCEAPLPDLPHTPIASADQTSRRLRRRGLELATKEKLTIHVIGARGDIELECRWTSMLERLPFVRELQIILVGFCDGNDKFGTFFPGDDGDYFSPPLVKKNQVGMQPDQKVSVRIFKGTYSMFLKSSKVADEAGAPVRWPKLTIGCGRELPVSAILLEDANTLFPDLIVISDPSFSRYFDSWIPDISQILLAQIPIVFFGTSALELPSHDADQIAGILPHLRARFRLPLQWNPFPVALKPDADLPPMPIRKGSEVIQYRGISAKYAVRCVVLGFSVDEGQDPDDVRHFLIDLVEDEEGAVKKFRRLLVDKYKVDAETARIEEEKLRNDPEIQRNVIENVKKAEERVKEMREAINNRIGVKSPPEEETRAVSKAGPIDETHTVSE